ncbi:MAG TPA: aminotransferase class III-fold pyridoxal phosphate-dependent enzyme [Bacillota bacterium]|nr:aminotransferase class III-fold pyridoxal phosphate-dependent enzyme [Bacillota bacterium]
MKQKLFDLNFDSEPAGADERIELKKIAVNDIAIIGMAAKLPLVNSITEFWEGLKAGRDFIGFPGTRRKADIIKYQDYRKLDWTRFDFFEAAFLNEIDTFDDEFFNISKKEASLMDPYQRLFLETVWHALEDSGYAGKGISGSKTGIYLGYPGDSGYYAMVKELEPDFHLMAAPGNLPAIIASRISYILDLKGPSLLVDTSCSSSLVALHLACQALINGECQMAIAGGLNLILNPIYDRNQEKPEILSSSGRARSFDDSADGTGAGEGSVALILKPLSKAMVDGDQIHAVIKGSAVNQDGSSIGITAPNALAQKEVIMAAWEKANIDPETITYIEAHGTGTKLGDPIEIRGITEAFRNFTAQKQFCAIGAIKSNIGHLDSAAGIVGLLKAVLCLKYRQIPPIAHFTTPNQKIDFADSPVYINPEPMDWQTKEDQPRRCGVSSFGLSGTNCHVVLEEAPRQEKQEVWDKNSYHILCLAAKTEDALKRLVESYREFFKTASPDDIGDICYSANTGRRHENHRIAIVGNSLSDFLDKMPILTSQPFIQIRRPNIYYGSFKVVAAHQTIRPENEYSESQLTGLSLEVNGKIDDWLVQNKLDEGFYQYLGEVYTRGAEIEWGKVYRNHPGRMMGIPLYPFARNLRWLEIPESGGDQRLLLPKQPSQPADSRSDDIREHFRRFIADAFHIDITEVEYHHDFFELGVDSISIIQIKQEAAKQYKVDISTDELLQNIPNINALAEYIDAALPLNESKPVPRDEPGCIHQKDEIRRISPGPMAQNQAPNRFLRRFIVKEDQLLNERQAAFLKEFAAEYLLKTKKSSEKSRQYGPTWANDRFIQGYSSQWKELIYPIMAERALGSRMWDVDGNEYLDFSMGFGAILLGYNHPLVNQAVKDYCPEGIIIGPITPFGGEVAGLIHELTGVERVSFFNSGTEAVMIAVRMARATTGRNKIALFTGSFHGTFDGVNIQRDFTGGPFRSTPVSLGTPASYAEDVMVLEYGVSESLAIIQDHISELAAVLVEPVQSRRPQLQPREFLHELRRITAEHDVALIFDEVITGFRLHPGGAQAYFEVQADIVTYGKIAGGGMPLGIVAGKAKFMNRLDGGMWEGGAEAQPDMDLIVSGGTFSCHPLAMVAAKAILTYIKSQGPPLYNQLNQRTRKLAGYLNDYFNRGQLPLEMVYCASMFSFKPKKDLLFLRFLFYKLALKGIYLWEGATCFLSTAHSDEDIAGFIKAIKDSCYELAITGCFTVTADNLPRDNPLNCDWLNFAEDLTAQTQAGVLKPAKNRERTQTHDDITKIPLTDEQLRMWILSMQDPETSIAYNENIMIPLKGDLKLDLMRKAFQAVVDRHESLRVTKIDGKYLYVKSNLPIDLPLVTLPAKEGMPEAGITNLEPVIEWIGAKNRRAFNLSEENPLAPFIIKLSVDYHLVFAVIHHIIADGWSIGAISTELMRIYFDYCQGKTPQLPEPKQFSDYVAWQHNQYQSPTGLEAERYWKQKFSREVPGLKFPALSVSNGNRGEESGGYLWIKLDPARLVELKQFSRKQNVSLFITLISVYSAFLYRVTYQNEFVISIPFSGQLKFEAENLVGHCVNMLPLYIIIDEEMSFQTLLKAVKEKLLEINKYQVFSLSRIIETASQEAQEYFIPEPKVVFNMDHAINNETACAGLQIDDEFANTHYYPQNKYDLFLDVLEDGKQLHLRFEYNRFLLSDAIIREWSNYFEKMLIDILQHAERSLYELDMQD